MFGNHEHAIRKRMLPHLYSKLHPLASQDFQGTAQVLVFRRLMPVLDGAMRTGEGIDVFALGCATTAEVISMYGIGTGNGLDLVRIWRTGRGN
jgi:hypothetical protein